MFSKLVFTVRNALFLTELLQKIVFKFASVVFSGKNRNRLHYILLQVKYSDGQYKTPIPAAAFRVGKVAKYIYILLDVINTKEGDYINLTLDELTFSYFLVPVKDEHLYKDRSLDAIAKLVFKQTVENFEMEDISMNLPLNRDYSTWNIKGCSIFVDKSGEVTIRTSETGTIVMIFKDRAYRGDSTMFIRRVFPLLPPLNPIIANVEKLLNKILPETVEDDGKNQHLNPKEKNVWITLKNFILN